MRGRESGRDVFDFMDTFNEPTGEIMANAKMIDRDVVQGLLSLQQEMLTDVDEELHALVARVVEIDGLIRDKRRKLSNRSPNDPVYEDALLEFYELVKERNDLHHLVSHTDNTPIDVEYVDGFEQTYYPNESLQHRRDRLRKELTRNKGIAENVTVLNADISQSDETIANVLSVFDTVNDEVDEYKYLMSQTAEAFDPQEQGAYSSLIVDLRAAIDKTSFERVESAFQSLVNKEILNFRCLLDKDASHRAKANRIKQAMNDAQEKITVHEKHIEEAKERYAEIERTDYDNSRHKVRDRNQAQKQIDHHTRKIEGMILQVSELTQELQAIDDEAYSLKKGAKELEIHAYLAQVLDNEDRFSVFNGIVDDYNQSDLDVERLTTELPVAKEAREASQRSLNTHNQNAAIVEARDAKNVERSALALKHATSTITIKIQRLDVTLANYLSIQRTNLRKHQEIRDRLEAELSAAQSDVTTLENDLNAATDLNYNSKVLIRDFGDIERQAIVRNMAMYKDFRDFALAQRTFLPLLTKEHYEDYADVVEPMRKGLDPVAEAQAKVADLEKQLGLARINLAETEEAVADFTAGHSQFYADASNMAILNKYIDRYTGIINRLDGKLTVVTDLVKEHSPQQ